MSFTYKGLSAGYARHTVTEAEVERQLQRLLQQNPRIATVTDRPTRLGDEVVLDYAGFCGEEQFPGGTAENQTLVLGSGQFIPGFEEQLVDKVPGEQVDVTVTFPTQYHAPELAGKEAVFRCKLHEIREKTPYELDDTFAKEVGECENMTEMRSKLQGSLQAYADRQGEMDLQDRLLRQAAQTLDYTVTDELMEKALDEQMQTLEAQLARQGLNLDMYCSFMSTTKEKLREDARPTAEAALRSQAAIEKIVELEDLSASQQEMGEAVALIARENGMTVEQLKPYYDAEFEAAVVRSILTSKVMSLIKEAAILTEE